MVRIEIADSGEEQVIWRQSELRQLRLLQARLARVCKYFPEHKEYNTAATAITTLNLKLDNTSEGDDDGQPTRTDRSKTRDASTDTPDVK
jgi:hypothetical protein